VQKNEESSPDEKFLSSHQIQGPGNRLLFGVFLFEKFDHRQRGVSLVKLRAKFNRMIEIEMDGIVSSEIPSKTSGRKKQVSRIGTR